MNDKWRFKNLMPTLEPLINEEAKAKLIRTLEQPLAQDARQVEEELQEFFGSKLFIERAYGFGRSIDEIISVLEMSIKYTHRCIRMVLDILLETEAEDDSNASLDGKYRWSSLGISGTLRGCLLIDRPDLLLESTNLVQRLIDSPWPRETNPYTNPDYLRIQTDLTKPCINPDALGKLHAFRKKQRYDVPEYTIVSHIIQHDASAFNECIRERLNGLGSERTRARRRNITPGERFLFWELGVIALALHNGIPLTVKDEAIPIHEFPIAQRAEIKALLPE